MPLQQASVKITLNQVSRFYRRLGGNLISSNFISGIACSLHLAWSNILRLGLCISLLATCALFARAQDEQQSVPQLQNGPVVAAASGTDAPPPRPTTDKPFDESVDLYSGSFKLAIPLLHIGGRGGASADIAAVIQPEHISGSSMLPYNLSLVDEYVGGNAPIKEYYNKLIRFGAGYGPGVLYTNFLSFEDPANWHGRRPAHLTFVDSSGKTYTLRDRQVLTENHYFFTSNNRYDTSLYAYRNATLSGQVYQGVEDNGMVFGADAPISVHDSNSSWWDHAYNALDYPIMPSGFLYLRDGSRMRINSGYVAWISDRNGNTIHFYYEEVPNKPDAQSIPLRRVNRIVDTLNREVTIQYGSYTTPDIITYKGVNNTLRTIKVQKKRLQDALQPGDTTKSFATLYPEYAGILNNTLRLPASYRYNPEVIASIEFPDGKSYTLQYDSFGELVWVLKPHGSKVQYKYGPGIGTMGGVTAIEQPWDVPDGINGGTVPGDIEYWLFYRRLIESKTYLEDNTALNRVTYSTPETPGNTGSDPVKVDTYDAADHLIAEQKHYFFDRFARQHMRTHTTLKSEMPLWSAGLEKKVEFYNIVNGNPALVKTVENNWTHGPFNVTPGVGDYSWWDGNPDHLSLVDRPRITSVTTTLNETGQVSYTEYLYDKFLNKTDTFEHQFGLNTPGPVVRHTHTDYLTFNPVNNIDYSQDTVYLVGLPVKQIVYKGNSATPASEVDYEYDNYTQDTGPNPSAKHHDALRTLPGIVNLCLKYDFYENCIKDSTASYGTRGNLTKVTSYADAASAGGAISTYSRYDMAGNVVSVTDGNDHVTDTDYSDNFDDSASRSTYAYATSTSSAIPDTTDSSDPTGPKGSGQALRTLKKYDYWTGLPTSTQDANGLHTDYFYEGSAGFNGSLDRLMKVSRPDGGWTTYEYGDDLDNFFVHTQTLMQVAPTQQVQHTYEYFDRMGRSVRNLTADGSSPEKTWIAHDTQYDEMGRAKSISNPYFTTTLSSLGDSSKPQTQTKYDALGRTTTVTMTDGGKVITNYKGSQVMATDQAGRSRRTDMDALGRTTQLVEFTRKLADPTIIEDPNSTDYVTTYEYDDLDNLHKVTQGTQTRTFEYDSFKHLRSALNPENGTISYEYDNNGNLKKRTDARNIQTDYVYDALNRLTQRRYSVVSGAATPQNYTATPQVDYYYDGTGQFTNTDPTPANSLGQTTAIKSSVSQTIFTEFDSAGHVKTHLQVVDPLTNPQRYEMKYTYNLAGSMTSQQYPSGRIIVSEYDSAGRLAGVRNQGSTEFIAGGAPAGTANGENNSIQYAAHGAVSAMRLGNHLWEHTEFNDRLQPKLIGLGISGADSSTLQLEYKYGLIENAALNTAKNNGNLQSQIITAPGLTNPIVQTYTYDQVNRLLTAEESYAAAAAWTQKYKYDQFGNRNYDTGTTYPALQSNLVDPANNPVISTGTNRIDRTITGQDTYKYDAAGNLTNTSNLAFNYDGENRQVSNGYPTPGTATCSYDGDGKRVKKTTGNNTVTTVYVYNILGQMVEEYSSDPPDAGGTRYVTADSLGTPRVITDVNQAVLERHDYTPFGESIYSGFGERYRAQGYNPLYNGTSELKQKFTGQERDDETQQDFFQSRYYSFHQGRFTSPDEFNGGPSELFAAGASANPTFYADLTNPQSFNKYHYALNNPLRYIDPTGHDVTGFFGYLGNWFAQKADPEKAAEQGNVSEGSGPLGLSPEQVAMWSAQTYATGVAVTGDMMEALGLDFGVNEFSKQMAASAQGHTDTVGLALASGKMVGSVLALGVGGEFEGSVNTPAALDGVESLNPSTIRFSQSSVNGVEELATSMSTNGWKGAPIDVVKMSDGGLTTVDNTRVLAAHMAGIDAQAVVHESTAELPAQLIERFSTHGGGVPQTWGDAVANRIGGQNSLFRSTYPYGSPFTGIH